jgi:hypothetical protein
MFDPTKDYATDGLFVTTEQADKIRAAAEWATAEYESDPDGRSVVYNDGLRAHGDWNQDEWKTCIGGRILFNAGWTLDWGTWSSDGAQELWPDAALSVVLDAVLPTYELGEEGSGLFAWSNDIYDVWAHAARSTGGLVDIPEKYRTRPDVADDEEGTL